MGEVAMQLFQQPPNAFVQELRKGKYPKTISSAPDVLDAVVQLNLEVEGSANHAGVMLLPPATVEALLQDKRRLDLLQSFKVALLKLASQVSPSEPVDGCNTAWCPAQILNAATVFLSEQLPDESRVLQFGGADLLALVKTTTVRLPPSPYVCTCRRLLALWLLVTTSLPCL
jgi:hypothetical protein